jgi:hypothetical protein
MPIPTAPHPGGSISSANLCKLELIAEEYVEITNLFMVLHSSKLPALKTLHIYLLAYNSTTVWGNGDKDPNISFTEADFKDQFPLVDTVQVTVSRGKVAAADDNVTFAALWAYLGASQFLQVVRALGILTVVFSQTTYGPDAE